MASILRVAAVLAVLLLSLEVFSANALPAEIAAEAGDIGAEGAEAAAESGISTGASQDLSNAQWWEEYGYMCGVHCGGARRRMLGQDAGTNVKKLRAAAARVDFDAANVSCSGLTPAFLHDKLVTVRLDATEAGLPHTAAARAVGVNITMYTSRVRSMYVPEQAYAHLTPLDFCPLEGDHVVHYKATITNVRSNGGAVLWGKNAGIRDCLVGKAVPVHSSHNDTALLPLKGPIVMALVGNA